MFRKDRYDMCDVEKFARIMEAHLALGCRQWQGHVKVQRVVQQVVIDCAGSFGSG